MAKIKALPGQAIISGFKGTLDFYLWMGIPCVRKWPRSPGRKRAPGVEAQWSAFTYAVREWNNLDQYVRETYQKISEGSGLTSRDWFIRSYIKGIFRYEVGEPY